MQPKPEMITDYAGNTFPASRLNEMESPSFDPIGAARDNVMKALPGIAERARAEQPGIGKRVIVIQGRKHRGKTGVCFWRGKDRFDHSWGRYHPGPFGDWLGLRDRIGIKTDAGESFFVPILHAELVKPAQA